MITSPDNLEPSHLQEKTLRLLKEALWSLFFFCAFYLALALFGYRHTDPTWSHATAQTAIANPAGHLGAFLSDTLFYIFGHSAWWLVGLLIIVPIRGLRLLHEQDRRPLYVCMLGFVLTLLASCTVEALHFSDQSTELPFAAGGIIGLLAARGIYNALGFVGSTLGLVVIFGIGLSLFIGFSWLSLSERLGHALESLALWATGKMRERQDRMIGRTTTLQREAVVDEVLAKEQTPVHIETPKTVTQPSPQIEEERTKQIFPLPPKEAKPTLDLLQPKKTSTTPIAPETVEFNSRQIELKLADFGIEAKTLSAYPGPVVTRYEIQPAVGVKGSQIMNLTKDLARSLSVSSVRIVETIPGKSCMGLELPNEKRQDVFLSEILGSRTFYESKSPLPLGLGKDIAGQPVIADLARMPHLLVAGTTGSGKSVGINAMILSVLYKSTVDEVRLILVDPKMLELSVYDGIGHLLTPVVTDMKEAAQALAWCVREMDRRYQLMSAMRVRNLAGFNQRLLEAQKKGEALVNPVDQSPFTSMPYIVVVIDELADLMMVAGKQVEELIARLAQKARAAGIHLILATQRPSVDVITGLIKANIPTRISFQVASKVDSRTILDQMGAESLLGQGDMLLLEPGGHTPTRIHGAFVSDDEVHRVVSYLKSAGPPPVYENLKEPISVDGSDSGDIEGEDDPLYPQAVTLVRTSRRASISLVQRHLRIGYNRSARMIERMEKEGLVSSMSGNGNREVLAPMPSSNE